MCLHLYHGRGAFEAVLADEDVEIDPDRWCSYSECGQELWQIARPLGVEPAPLTGTDDAELSYVRSSGPHPKNLLSFSWLRKTHLKSMARGSGLQRSDEPRGVWGPMPLCCKRTGRCAALREPASLSSEVRQENAFTRASRLPGLPDRLSALFPAREVSGVGRQRQSCSSGQRCPPSLAPAFLR